jgi:hypothetical protein
MKPISRVAVLAVAATVLAGCGPTASTTTPPDAGTGAATTAPAPTTPTATATPTVGPPDDTADLPDGRSPVLIKSVDVAGRTITFDLIEFYSGADAETEWRKDHPTATEVPPLDGHYIRDSNPKLRTASVATTAVVKVISGGDPSAPTTLAFGDLPAYPQLDAPFWITLEEGVIVLVEQQFIS